jgi:hypothetical protein
VRIQLYKNKVHNAVLALPYSEHVKQNSLSTIETRVISDFVTNTCNAIIIGFVSSALNRLNLSQTVDNYLFLYFYQFIFPFVFIGSIAVI